MLFWILLGITVTICTLWRAISGKLQTEEEQRSRESTDPNIEIGMGVIRNIPAYLIAPIAIGAIFFYLAPVPIQGVGRHGLGLVVALACAALTHLLSHWLYCRIVGDHEHAIIG